MKNSKSSMVIALILVMLLGVFIGMSIPLNSKISIYNPFSAREDHTQESMGSEDSETQEKSEDHLYEMISVEQPASSEEVYLIENDTIKYTPEHFPEQKEETMSCENGDWIYIPGNDTIAYDEENHINYFTNTLIAYVDADMTTDEREELAESVGGKLAGNISGIINVIQIMVEDRSLSDLERLAEVLMGQNGVIYASYDIPQSLNSTAVSSEEDNNPWSNWDLIRLDKKGDEESPGGNDWWAEAIGAYTAWSYSDYFGDVTVGVMDNGVDRHHPELEGNVLACYNDLYGSDISNEAHGTSVCGVICAKNNDIGLRGIACGNDNNVEVRFVDFKKDYIFAGLTFYVEGSKALIENGASAINYSFGKTFFTDDTEREKDVEARMRADADRKGIVMMLMIDSILSSGKDKVMFVQAAGNGMRRIVDDVTAVNENDNKDLDEHTLRIESDTADVTLSGYFDSARESLYDEYASMFHSSYEDIKNHIMVVSAVKRKDSEDSGDYDVVYHTECTGIDGRWSSSIGETVDICAPGTGIYSTIPGNAYTNKGNDGTSFAAPMVTASVGVLWSINPGLTAEEVKNYLINNYRYKAKNPDIQSGFGAKYSGKEYPMLNIGEAVKAVIRDMEDASVSPEITPEPAVPESDYLKELLEYLKEQYGVIASDNGVYSYIADEQVAGLLYGEIFDYDRDRENELVVFRVDPYPQTATHASSWIDTLILSVYKDDGSYSASDEFRIPFPAWTNDDLGEHCLAVHLFRYDYYDVPTIGVDYYHSYNSQTFGLLGFSYENTHGIECTEFEDVALIDRGYGHELFKSIIGREFDNSDRPDWEETWRSNGDMSGLQEQYNSYLKAFGLTESNPRFRNVLFADNWEEDLRIKCQLKPSEHYQTDEHSSIIDCCGISSTYSSNGMIWNTYGNLDNSTVPD